MVVIIPLANLWVLFPFCLVSFCPRVILSSSPTLKPSSNPNLNPNLEQIISFFDGYSIASHPRCFFRPGDLLAVK